MNTYSLYNMYGVLKTREDDVKEELKEKSYSGPLDLVKKEEYFRSSKLIKLLYLKFQMMIMSNMRNMMKIVP